MKKTKPIQKLLAANRSEIAIRIFRAATELGLRTVGIYSQEDRLGLHRFKADEAYQVGSGKGPVEAYLDIAGIVALAKEIRVGVAPPPPPQHAELEGILVTLPGGISRKVLLHSSPSWTPNS